MRIRHVLLTAWAALAFVPPADASLFRVTIDTVPLAGVSGFAAFDFIVGAPAAGNSAVLNQFTSDGTASTSSSTGDVAGTLVPGPLLLGGGSQLFSEWLQGFSAFGSLMTFDIDLGANTSPGGRPDQFAFFLLDGSQLPFATTDPTGAGALFFFNLTGLGTAPVIYTSAFAAASIEPIGADVSEPVTLLLALAALASMGLARVGRSAARARPQD